VSNTLKVALTLDPLPFQLRRSRLGLYKQHLDMIRTMKMIRSNHALLVNGSSGHVYSQGLQQ